MSAAINQKTCPAYFFYCFFQLELEAYRSPGTAPANTIINYCGYVGFHSFVSLIIGAALFVAYTHINTVCCRALFKVLSANF